MDPHACPPEPGSDVHAPTTLPFGPYAGRDVAFVAVADPSYLLDLVREGVGSDALRAEAARVLAQRARLVPLGASWLEPAPGARDVGAVPPALDPPRAREDPCETALGTTPVSARDAVHAVAGACRRGIGAALGAARPWQLGLAVGAALGVGLVVDGRHAEPAEVGLARAEPPFGAGAYLPATAVAAAVRRPSGVPSAATALPSVAGDAPDAAVGPPPCGARIAGAIPAESAGDYLDTFQAVEFEVVQAKDTGRVTFLNSRIPYAGAFYVAIFPDDYAAFPEPPATYLAGRCVVVQGTIETYRGAPQIVLRHPDDLRIVGDGDPTPGEPSDPAPTAAIVPSSPTTDASAPSIGDAPPSVATPSAVPAGRAMPSD